MAKLIHLLDNDTINKIAAGEVIENPKSIVKELVENSIDAEADEIIVEIKNGGKKLIRITDNGKGINRDEIEDAFKRHCTSKINSSDDLNSLFTLGFRGEALASIAAVSRIEIISRIKDEQYGVHLIIEGGMVLSKEDIGCPVGTTISVTELFFNVPARKKFLKSDTSESGQINEIVTSLSLSKENISFKYINNNNIAFKTPKTNDFINTISSLYEKDLYQSLLKVDYKSSIIKIYGYITNLNYYRGNRKHQLLFVNDRFVKHKRVNYFIEAAYYTLLPKNKYPACFLKMEMDASLIDVNVHPAKTEIRFQNEEIVLNEIKKAIYQSLNSNNIIKEIKKENVINNKAEERINTKFESIFESEINSEEEIFNNKYKEFTKKNLPGKILDANNISENFKSEKIDDFGNLNNINYIADKNDNKEQNFEFKEDDYDSYKNIIIDDNIIIDEKDNIQESFINNDIKDDIAKYNIIPELNIVGTLMKTYIICEDIKNSEMYMIDQHAAHERINYELFLNQYNNKEILKQELMVPEVINLLYDDYYNAINNKEIFAKLGIDIETFGVNSILISNIPVIFYRTNIKDLFMTMLDSVKNTNKQNLDLEIEKIIKNACVKSVKSGDKLHLLEIEKLISDLRNTVNPYTCPHGRPVIIKISKYEIEKMFERIQN